MRIVAPGETLEARTAIVTYPPVFEEALDRFPQVAPEHVVVVVNQMAERDSAGLDVAYDPPRVRAHLRELLGSEGLWAPISERVRALMEADPRIPRRHVDTWTPPIDTARLVRPRSRSGAGEPARARSSAGTDATID